MYILSSGLIDDLADLLKSLDSSWDSLPIQIHVINLSGPNLNTEDLDTLRFQEQTMKLNLQLSGWLQFNVHYYDRIKFKYGGDDEAIEIALEQLKEQAVESIPRELEAFMFLNSLEPNRQAVKSAVHQ